MRLEDTLRIGVARGDYPEAIGREEEWIAGAARPAASIPVAAHEQTLADGRTILIEERRTSDGGIIGLRVDITEMKRREASFRLLFDGNPVPMFVYALDDLHILAVNDAAVAHYGYGREQVLQMTLRDIHDPAEHGDLGQIAAETPEEHSGWTWRHRKADGTMIDVAIFLRQLTYESRPAALIAAVDITERKRAEARVAFMAHHDALDRAAQPHAAAASHGGDDRRDLRAQRSRLCRALRRSRQFQMGQRHAWAIRSAICCCKPSPSRLRAELREQDTIARLGGDEFAILQADVGQPEEVSDLLARLLSGDRRAL